MGNQSRIWLGSWIAILLAVTILLVLADAPPVAYGVPLASLLLVNRCHLEVEVGEITARLGATRPVLPVDDRPDGRCGPGGE
jgi:hypothetical protein